jgi:hypothetical protein
MNLTAHLHFCDHAARGSSSCKLEARSFRGVSGCQVPNDQ